MTRAMVLAAGLGTRMRPLTDVMPKPLVPVAGKPLIDRTLDFLAGAGVTDAVVNSFYKAEMLEAYLAKRTAAPRITISREEELLETGGGIKKALPLLGGKPFFIANSDVICIDGKTPALHRLQAAWDDARMDVLLLLHPVASAVGYDGKGDFFLREDGTPRRRTADETAPYVFTGVQILHPRLFADSPDGAFSLNVLFNRALEARRIATLVHDGKWLHVGDPAGVAAAEAEL
ncbi:MAG: nucleotidyltransferase family protein [Alphaproteobacteria bacterium]|nr:nucleotidyltransferase family protein [Alphaproteobacteria bacterium]